MSSKNTYYLFGTIIIVALCYFITRFNQNRKEVLFLRNAAMTIGKFTGELEKSRKGSNGPWYVCQYTVNDVIYETTEPSHMVDKLGSRVFESYFPVIFDSTNPSNGYVLIFPSEFEKFNLIYPDSLNWVIK